jgi:ribosomal protein S18 acetylase RimI-like enzyme
MLIKITLFVLLFGICEGLKLPINIKRYLNKLTPDSTTIKKYDHINFKEISTFITNERYENLPRSSENDMINMIQRDFLKRKQKYYLGLPFTILVASKENNIVGVITIESSDINIDGKINEYPIISNLIVSKHMRRRGIGKKLTESAEKLAKSFGFKEVYLFVDIENLTAIGLYKSKRYKIIGNTKKSTKILFKNDKFNNIHCKNSMMKKNI